MSDVEDSKTIKLQVDHLDLVKVNHRSSYRAISPLRPELSQKGRTVLIAGASAGVGLSTVKAYAEASAATVILTGRREDKLHAAASELTKEFQNTKFDVRVCDVADVAEASLLWDRLHADGIIVDVLVLSAAKFSGQESILDSGFEAIWSLYEANVRSLLLFTEKLYKQDDIRNRIKFIVYVSTAAIHSKSVAAALPGYTLSKASGHLAMQKIAGEVDANKLQIITFHPGAILSESAQNAGMDRNSYPWDEDNLPGHFAVWAATAEAASLHGRFVWATWDVDELLSGDLRERIETDPDFLTIGFVGI
ncbi:NAD(P)-binding protein [Cadophora sp. DSE1049]|nr:NAD(P)-binding protein [Cadophora sp. DSE1049]